MKKNKPQHHTNFPNTRKTLRKQKRQEKKVHRQEHYKKKKTTQEPPKYTPGRFVKRPADDSDTVVQPKKKKQKIQTSSQDILVRERQKEKKEVAKLNSQIDEQRKKMLLQANEDEDKMIKKLEKQLGLNKAKNKNNYFAEDGLDYLLEICDRATSEQIVAAEKHLAEVENESDFEEDLAAVTGKEIPNKEKDKNKKSKDTKDKSSNKNGDIDDEFNDDDNEIEDDSADSEMEGSEELGSDDDMSVGDEEDYDDNTSDEEKDTTSAKPVKPQQKYEIKKTDKPSKEKIIKAEDLHKVFSDDEVSHLSGDDEDLEGFSGDEIDEDKQEESEKKTKEKPDVWEDIYGRKRDKEGNVIKEEKGIYIPPHLRNKDSISDKDLVQLKRQIKSVLNKLAGTNLHWACSSIEQLYSSNSRNSVNTALSNLWLEATVGPSVTPDRLVAEHAALVAVLHANVGSEIGAHFLQELTKKFDKMLESTQPMENKSLDNLICSLSYLYNFKIYHANLMYDILSRLMESISEKHIECVLVALRTVGGTLRKEEPLLLKNFIHDTQEKVAALNQAAADGSRIKFLLEVLLAVKNNNLTKIPHYDPSYCELLKKTVRGVIRKGNYVTPLNIRLEDLLKADERGKWWVVGSAWEGNRLPSELPAAAACDQRLLELARQQRMNTDVRRSIFCVIMAAEDYLSAFEKLSGLGLRGGQQREIAHVLLACCLNERTYNPYYALLASKLCETDRKYQLSFQFSIWDKIKDLEQQPIHSSSNLALFLVHQLMETTLPLSVLKIIEFSELTKKTVKFMRQVLLSIIMNEDFEATLKVFHKIAKPPKLHMFRESLRLFIQHFLIKNAEKKNNVLSEKEMAILKERASEIDKILTLHESKVMF